MHEARADIVDTGAIEKINLWKEDEYPIIDDRVFGFLK
jgi:hypothetical protein